MQRPGDPLEAMGALPPMAGIVFELAHIVQLATDIQLFGGPCILGGWALWGDLAVASSLRILNGQDRNGELVALTSVNAGGTQFIMFPGNGVHFQNGLYIQRSNGFSTGAFFLYPGIPE